MVAVALVTAQVAIVRTVHFPYTYPVSTVERVVEPISPLLVVLLAGAYVFVRRPGRRAFLTGFESAGWLAAALWLVANWDRPRLLWRYEERIVTPLYHVALDALDLTIYALTHGNERDNALFLCLHIPLRLAAFSLPPLVLAAGCGRLTAVMWRRDAARSGSPMPTTAEADVPQDSKPFPL
jgi:hypothetical protein